jgi:flagellar basal body-associated protein FliL
LITFWSIHLSEAKGINTHLGGGRGKDHSDTKEGAGMSKVILGFVVLVVIVTVMLLLFIVAFGGALLVFSGKGKKEKEESGALVQAQRAIEQETI